MERSADVTRHRDGAIMQSTRAVAGVIIPFLLAATVILFFVGQDNLEQRFAWGISPALTAAYGGAGYFGGAYFFGRVLLGRRWRRVAAGFLPVAAFTAAMLAATLLHWSRFDPGHFPFQVWLILYIVTPVLVPLIWWRNQRQAAPDGPQLAADLPAGVRWGMALLSGAVTVGALLTLVDPNLAMEIWPWTLSQLTARFMAGWHLLLGVGGLVLARHPHWPAWRIPAQSILIWQGLVLISMVIHQADLTAGSLLNWYTGFVVGAVLAVAALYLVMERRGAGSTNA